MKLALFDFDGTLMAGDSEVKWSHLLAEEGLYEPAEVDAAYARQRSGEWSLERFYEWHLRPFVEEPRERLVELRERLLIERIRPDYSVKMLGRLEGHRRTADAIVLVSATIRFLIDAIAADLGFEHALATEMEQSGGAYTGRVLGTPCFRAGKVEHVARWLACRGTSWEGVEHACFYGDSTNDVPLLERVHAPFVVDPDPELHARAKRDGWTILSLR